MRQRLTRLILQLLAIPLLPLGAETIRETLPFDYSGVLDGARIRIVVPSNWNGALVVYLHGSRVGAAAPAEVEMVPRVMAGSLPLLEPALLARGYALAASDFGADDLGVKEGADDTTALIAYFQGRVGEPTRVIAVGQSGGGLSALKLAEDRPRYLTGALAACPPASGMTNNADRWLDFSVAYAAAFGWPADKWGPVEDVRAGLNFQRDVAPAAQVPTANGSNRGNWEFVRLITKTAPEAFWTVDPMQAGPGWAMKLLSATVTREQAEGFAGGPVAQNAGRKYTLTAREKADLSNLGVNADELLAKVNSRADIVAGARSRDYLERFGGVRGMLRRPAVTLHTTLDGLTDVSHESAYRQMVAAAGRQDMLVQAYVKGVGHCAFTSAQVLAGLDAVESWIASGVAPGARQFPEELGFDNSFVPAPW